MAKAEGISRLKDGFLWLKPTEISRLKDGFLWLKPKKPTESGLVLPEGEGNKPAKSRLGRCHQTVSPANVPGVGEASEQVRVNTNASLRV